MMSKTWRRWLAAIAALILLGTGGPAAWAADKVIAVLEFNDTKLKEVASKAQVSLVDILATSISNGTGLKVIDKDSVERVKARDTAWQQSGFADPKTALTFAQQLKANFVVVGSVSQAAKVTRDESTFDFTVSVEVKAMDNTTGQVIASATATGKMTAQEIRDEEGVVVKAIKDPTGLFVKAARQAIEQAGRDLGTKLNAVK